MKYKTTTCPICKISLEYKQIQRYDDGKLKLTYEVCCARDDKSHPNDLVYYQMIRPNYPDESYETIYFYYKPSKLSITNYKDHAIVILKNKESILENTKFDFNDYEQILALL